MSELLDPYVSTPGPHLWEMKSKFDLHFKNLAE